MARGVKRRLAAALSVVAGLVLFAFILHAIDLGHARAAVLKLGLYGALLSGLNVAAMVLGWVWSWKILLNAYGLFPSWRLMLRAILGGYTLSYLTPSMYFGGEPLRIYLLSKELGASATQVTASVVIWKLLEGFSLVTFVLMGSVNGVLSGALGGRQEVFIAVGNALLLGGWAVVAWGVLTKRFWASGFCGVLARRFPVGRARLERLKDWLFHAETDIHEAFSTHTSATIKALVLCFLVTFSTYMRPWIFFHFSAELDLDFRQLSFIFALFFFLSTFLWLTPGGIGISELGLMGIFGLVEGRILPADAVAYSLTIKGMELMFVAVGLFILVHFGLVQLPHMKRSKR